MRWFARCLLSAWVIACGVAVVAEAQTTSTPQPPEGSRANPLSPNEEVVGRITGDPTTVDIVVERVQQRGSAAAIWLFSSQTLDAVPTLYEQDTSSRANAAIPRVLFDARFAGVRLLGWLAVLPGLPLIYLATTLLNRLLTPVVHAVWRRLFRSSDLSGRSALPAPARLLVAAKLTTIAKNSLVKGSFVSLVVFAILVIGRRPF